MKERYGLPATGPLMPFPGNQYSFLPGMGNPLPPGSATTQPVPFQPGAQPQPLPTMSPDQIGRFMPGSPTYDPNMPGITDPKMPGGASGPLIPQPMAPPSMSGPPGAPQTGTPYPFNQPRITGQGAPSGSPPDHAPAWGNRYQAFMNGPAWLSRLGNERMMSGGGAAGRVVGRLKMRAPSGEMQDIDPAHEQHYLQRGAVRA